MKRIALLPGSFDPITTGHLAILEQALKLFDEVVLVLSGNEHKKTLFSLSERLLLTQKSIANIPNTRVITHTKGLLVDVARELNAVAIVRGVRNTQDFLFEQTMAQYNRNENNMVKTVLLLSDAEHVHISSSGVKELFRIGGDVSKIVPVHVVQALDQKIVKEELDFTE